MSMLDLDPFDIECWEEYALACLKAGEMWRFRKALSDYLFWTDRPYKEELRAYIDRRRGEIAREKLDEQIKRKKPRLPNVHRKFV